MSPQVTAEDSGWCWPRVVPGPPCNVPKSGTGRCAGGTILQDLELQRPPSRRAGAERVPVPRAALGTDPAVGIPRWVLGRAAASTGLAASCPQPWQSRLLAGNVDRVQTKPITTSQCAGDFPSTTGKTGCRFSQCFNHLFSVPRKRNLAKTPPPKLKKHHANKFKLCNSPRRRQAINRNQLLYTASQN